MPNVCLVSKNLPAGPLAYANVYGVVLVVGQAFEPTVVFLTDVFLNLPVGIPENVESDDPGFGIGPRVVSGLFSRQRPKTY